MKLYRQEVARRFCDQCQKLHWHDRNRLDSRFHIYLVVLSILTLGLAWPILQFLIRYYGAWKCKYCGRNENQVVFVKRVGQAVPSRDEQALTPTHLIVPVTYAEETLPIPPAQEGPTDRRGSYSDSKEFLNRPQYGCTSEQYWAWHDTLYLGGSRDSMQWAERAKEAKARDNFRCVSCGSRENLETDHIIELSRGGSNDFDNLQTLCSACHLIKTQNNRRRN